MQIAPVSFTGKNEIRNFAKQYGPLSQSEMRLKEMAEKYHDIEVDRTSDGDYITASERDFSLDLLNAIKAFKFTPSMFAYKTAIDLKTAEANKAILGGGHDFAKAAREIAEYNPEITKEMILDDFEKLN